MLDLTNDIIDVRDIIERYEELEDSFGDFTIEDRDELEQLHLILEELKGNGGDEQWRGDWYPLTLIRDGVAFEEYMDQMLEDCGEIPKEFPSYIRVSIDYDMLKWDYTTIEIDGDDYLYR